MEYESLITLSKYPTKAGLKGTKGVDESNLAIKLCVAIL